MGLEDLDRALKIGAQGIAQALVLFNLSTPTPDVGAGKQISL